MVNAHNPLRFKAAILGIVLTLQFTLYPVRQANAFLPLAVGLAVPIAQTSAGSAFLQSLAIHATILSIGFYATSGGSTPPPNNSADKRLDVKLNPKDLIECPSGWTRAAAPSIDCVAPSTASTTIIGYRYSNWNDGSSQIGGLANNTLPTKQAVVDAQWAYAGSRTNNTANTYTHTFNDSSTCSIPVGSARKCFNASETYAYIGTGTNGTTASTTQFQTMNGCPSGYTLSGSTCNKTTESAVVKPTDSKCQITRTGNTMTYDTRDPDCGNGVATRNVNITTDTITVASDDGLTSSTVKLNADGTSSVTENKARTDGSAKTDRYVTNLTAPNATTGETAVSGFSASTYSGVGSGVSTDPDLSVGGTSDAKDSSLQQIRGELERENALVDTDRTAANAAATALPDTLTNAGVAGQYTVDALGLPTQSSYLAPDTSPIGNALPSNNGDCVALNVDLPYLGSMTIAPCAVVTVVRPLVDFLTISLGVIGGVFVLLGRREET